MPTADHIAVRELVRPSRPAHRPAQRVERTLLGGALYWILPVARRHQATVSGATRSILHACVRGQHADLRPGRVVGAEAALNPVTRYEQAKLAGVPVATEGAVVSTTNSKGRLKIVPDCWRRDLGFAATVPVGTTILCKRKKPSTAVVCDSASIRSTGYSMDGRCRNPREPNFPFATGMSSEEIAGIPPTMNGF